MHQHLDPGHPVARRQQGQAGFTLIELMISITIGLAILAALVGVLATSSSNAKTNDRTSELLSNGRFALDAMKKELREAGFRGYTWADPTTATGLGTVTNECLESGATASFFVSNLRQAVWGSNNTDPFTANCIPATDYVSGTDVLVVRRLGVVPATALAVGNLYFSSTYERGQVFLGTTRPGWYAAGMRPYGDFPLQTYVYFVSPYTVSATESPKIPALFRVSLNGTTMAKELVASGIERMQVQYGRRTTAPATQYLNAGTAPLTQSSFTTDKTDWEDVNSVRIWILARGSTVEPGLNPSTTTYAMGDDSYTPPNDGFRRQLFTTIVQLRN